MSQNQVVACYRKDDGTVLIVPTADNPRGLGVHVNQGIVLLPAQSSSSELGRALRNAIPYCDYSFYDPDNKNPHLAAAGTKSHRDFAKRWFHVLVRFWTQIDLISSKRFKDGQDLYLKNHLILALDATDEELGQGLTEAFHRCMEGTRP